MLAGPEAVSFTAPLWGQFISGVNVRKATNGGSLLIFHGTTYGGSRLFFSKFRAGLKQSLKTKGTIPLIPWTLDQVFSL